MNVNSPLSRFTRKQVHGIRALIATVQKVRPLDTAAVLREFLNSMQRQCWKFVLCAAALSPCINWGQSPPANTPIIKANVREILVPAVVTDKKGHPISNLKESDFKVFENDVPQHIVAFSKTREATADMLDPLIMRSASTTARTAAAKEVGPDSPTRTYVVCVDTLHSDFSNAVQARRALVKFFEHERDGKAQYALMNLSRRVEVIQDSTRDPSLVLSALESKKFQGSLVDSESSSIALESEQLRYMLRGFSPEACSTGGVPAVRIRGTIPDRCSNMERSVELFVNTHAERTALLTRLFIQELKTIIQTMAGMPTQRTLILISDGFNLVPGRELFGIASAYFPNEPEWRMNERDTQTFLDEVVRLAQKNNVVVYGLDSRGLYTPAYEGLGDPSHRGDGDWRAGHAMVDMMRNEKAIAWENGSAMAQLAAATGGIYFHNNNDLLAGLHRAFDDERERYLISYLPSNTSFDGKYRNIRVEVKGKDFKVHAKAGYWATGD